jgi:FtsH-binding integral membrane protein
MADKQTFNHQVRQTAFLTAAIVFGLVFGIILVANGDWIPGGIIAVAGVIGLSVQIPVIAKLCRGGTAPSPPGSKR